MPSLCGSKLSMPEILDFGYPQNSEVDALKTYITTESIKSELAVVRPVRWTGIASMVMSDYCAARRLLKDHDSGDGRDFMETVRRQVPEERGVRGRH